MIIKSLHQIASKMVDPGIPDRKPDEIDDKNQIWYLGENYKLMVNKDGDKVYTKNGIFHREDGPAIIYTDGAVAWFLNGKLHREDGPAIERADGAKEWWLNDHLHREDGPAIEYSDGSKYWYLNGKKIKSKDCDSPQFKKRWKKLLELEQIRQVMED